MKLIIILGTMLIAAALAVMGITALLAVDDLKECTTPNQHTQTCAPADAIVAVSGGDTAARTAEAIALYKDGWAPKLLVSGAALDMTGPSNAEAMRRQALDAGVPEQALILDQTSQNTNANAANAAQLLGSVERVIVVTSPYHQRRASLEFKQAFGDKVTVISHPTPHDNTWSSRWWTTPFGWWLALSETIKLLFVVVLP